MKYRPEIDGLRTVAVLPVILFHAGFSLFSGGFVGVDIFFVISGYLITTIIISKLDEGRFSLLDFYNRRARRILPALLLVVVCTLPFAWVLMLPADFKDYGQSIAAVGLFSSNILFWLESGYFEASAELKPLLHTWSLAVEEQYYIFFPLLLMALWRKLPKMAIASLIVIFVLSLITSEILWRTAPDANFYLLPSRAWELMAGSLCAVVLLRRPTKPNQILSAFGLALVTLSIFVFDGDTPFPSIYALVPVAGTALIILFAGQSTWAGRVLSLRPMVGIGLISYSAYLWHQPLFAFARIVDGHSPALTIMLGLSIMSLVLAYFSWRFVETPTRSVSWSARNVVVSAGIMSCVVFAAGYWLSTSNTHQRYFMASLNPNNAQVLRNINQMRNMDHFATANDRECQFYIRNFTDEDKNRFDTCAARHGQALVIFGDSHSIDVYKGLVTDWDLPFLVGIGQEECRPHIAGNDCEGSDLLRFFEAHADQMAKAIYVQAGFWLFTDQDGNELARRIFTTGADIDPNLNTAAIDRAFEVLQPLDAMVDVTWLGPRIEPHVTFDAILARDCQTAPANLSLQDGQGAAFETLDVYLKEQSEARGIGYISEIDAADFDITSDLYSCEQLFWSDGDHWSPDGEARFGPRIRPAIQAVLTEGATQ